jgi:hypothetical protein
VNEFPRESLLKLFSYAVAALSNFFGTHSGTHESSPLVYSEASTVGPLLKREYECANVGAEGDRTHSGRAGALTK